MTSFGTMALPSEVRSDDAFMDTLDARLELGGSGSYVSMPPSGTAHTGRDIMNMLAMAMTQHPVSPAPVAAPQTDNGASTAALVTAGVSALATSAAAIGSAAAAGHGTTPATPATPASTPTTTSAAAAPSATPTATTPATTASTASAPTEPTATTTPTTASTTTPTTVSTASTSTSTGSTTAAPTTTSTTTSTGSGTTVASARPPRTDPQPHFTALPHDGVEDASRGVSRPFYADGPMSGGTSDAAPVVASVALPVEAVSSRISAGCDTDAVSCPESQLYSTPPSATTAEPPTLSSTTGDAADQRWASIEERLLR